MPCKFLLETFFEYLELTTSPESRHKIKSTNEFFQIFGKCNDTTTYMTTANPEKSNWFRYVRPASTRKDRNVVSVFKNGEMFFISSKDIAKGHEILYWTDIPNKVVPDKLCRKVIRRVSEQGNLGLVISLGLRGCIYLIVQADSSIREVHK